MNQMEKIAKALNISVSELLDNDIRNLIKEEIIEEEKENTLATDLLKIVGIILLILVLLLILFYM